MFDFGLLTIFSTDSPNSATQVDCLSGLASCAKHFFVRSNLDPGREAVFI